MKSIRRIRWVILGLILSFCFNLLLISIVRSDESETRKTCDIEVISSETITNLSAFQILDRGDKCFLQGNLEAARKLYGEVKKPFQKTDNFAEIKAETYEAEELSPGGKKHWQRYQKYREQSSQTSGMFISLFLLNDTDPNFIPGYLKLVELYKEYPEWCEYEGRVKTCQNRTKNALEVLEKASNLYPNNGDLVTARIEEAVKHKKYLDASIAARQFAIFNPDYPGIEKFSEMADKYFDRYQSAKEGELALQTALSCSADILTGNWSENFSGCGFALTLIKGESAIGTMLAEQYKQKLSIVEDEEVSKYVRGLAEPLIPLLGRDDFEYEFYVVRDDNLNAFALPGGKIFVNTGAILGTNSQAELAGLLGHEISHSVLSHGFSRMATGNFLNSLGRVVPVENIFSLLLNKYSRSQEREADILGTRVLANAGYAADGLRNFMATITKLEESNKTTTGSAFQAWESTHPASSERVRYLERLIENNGYNRYALEGVEKHREIQNRIQGHSKV